MTPMLFDFYIHLHALCFTFLYAFVHFCMFYIFVCLCTLLHVLHAFVCLGILLHVFVCLLIRCNHVNHFDMT
jgi:hypothetical protein